MVSRDVLRSTRNQILRLGREGLDWVTFAAKATELIRRAIPFERSCWHTVDPGTVFGQRRHIGRSGQIPQHGIRRLSLRHPVEAHCSTRPIGRR